MYAVRGTPVNINGHTGGTPGPATTTGMRVDVPMPPGRQIGGTPLAPARTFARYLRFRNLDATNNLQVYFYDNSFITVKPNGEEEVSGEVPFFTVLASAGTVQWEAFAVVAA